MFISLDEFFKKEIILSNLARDFTAEFKEIKSYLENFSEIGLIKASVKDDKIIVFDGVFRVVALGVLYGANIQTNSFLSKKYIKKLNKLDIKIPDDKKLFILNTSEDEFIKSTNLYSSDSDYLKLIDDLNLSGYRKIIEHYKGDYQGELKKLFLGVIRAVYKMNYQIGEKIEYKDIICKIINKNYQKKLDFELTNHIGKPLEKVSYDLARFCVDSKWLDVINNVYRKDLAGVLRAIYGGGEFKSDTSREIIEQNKLIKTLSKEFQDEIKKAKNHWYLDGRVKFLLDMSGQDLVKFKEYFRIFCIIFGNNPYKGDKHEADSKKMGGIINIKDKNGCEMLFRRALLTKGNYLRKKGEYYYFIKFGSEPYQKEKNFFYVFNNYQKLLKSLFDELLNSKDIEASLRQMIDDFSDTNDFRYKLIKEREHIKNLKLCKNKIYIDEKKCYKI